MRDRPMHLSADRRPRSLHAAADAARTDSALGVLPEWNLGDLYPSRDGSAFLGDLDRARKDSAAFQEKWQGRL